MACFSTSVEDVVKKNELARKQIELLQKGLEDTNSENRKIFDKKREEYFKSIGINDAKPKELVVNVKVEYASDFSLDQIMPVVKAAIETAVAFYNITTPIAPGMQDAFSNLAVAIGNAAKFSSSSSSSMSFSTSRLSKGIFVSLYAVSATVEDRSIFGKEAVTVTMYYYQTSESASDVRTVTDLEVALMYANSIVKLNKRILELYELAAMGTITFDDADRQVEAIRARIAKLQPTVARIKNDNADYRPAINKFAIAEKIDAALLLGKDFTAKSNAFPGSRFNQEKLLADYNKVFTELAK